MPVVRVLFRASNGRVREGNVLIDGGAGTTIIRGDFARTLGLQGKRERLDLSVVGGKQLEEKHSRRLKFWISVVDGGEEFLIEAHEIDKTVLNVQPLDRPWLSYFNHLSDLSFSHKEGPIDLILGVQYSHLHAEQEVREGLPYEPVEKRTILGWCVIGSDKTQRPAMASISFVQEIDIERMYDLETLGVQAGHCTCPKTVLSADDRKALELLELSCEKDGDRYVIGLPWKSDPKLLPDNYALAEKRLVSLEQNLLKYPGKADMYCKVMEEYERNGWAEVVKGGTEETRLYLPHHGGYSPDKVSTTLRVVFDPACSFQGVTLNSFLYKGSSLIGDLLGTLLRFREKSVAFIGVISKMYTHVHRYLWRNLDRSKEPTIYRLLRVKFGDRPSPDMASFVILKIAETNQVEYPEVVTILQRDRYMDDIIHACESEESAVKRMKGLDTVLATGSFTIKEWFCSSERATREMSKSSTQEMKDVPDSSSEVQDNVKTLGVSWNCNTDTIHFRVQPFIMEVSSVSAGYVL